MKLYKNNMSGNKYRVKASLFDLENKMSDFEYLRIYNASDKLNNDEGIEKTSEIIVNELPEGEGFYVLLEETNDTVTLRNSELDKYIKITKRSDGDYDIDNNGSISIAEEGDELDLHNMKIILGSVQGGSSGTSANSNICFLGSTPVETDQGREEISKLIPGYHTINKKEIKAITETITQDKYLYKIKRNAFERNKPSKDTIITGYHMIECMGLMKPVMFIKNKKIEKIEYSGEKLYNILMNKHEIIDINRMKVETLHPNNLIARLYNNEKFKNMKKEEKNSFMKKFNKRIKEQNIFAYTNH